MRSFLIILPFLMVGLICYLGFRLLPVNIKEMLRNEVQWVVWFLFCSLFIVLILLSFSL